MNVLIVAQKAPHISVHCRMNVLIVAQKAPHISVHCRMNVLIEAQKPHTVFHYVAFTV